MCPTGTNHVPLSKSPSSPTRALHAPPYPPRTPSPAPALAPHRWPCAVSLSPSPHHRHRRHHAAIATCSLPVLAVAVATVTSSSSCPTSQRSQSPPRPRHDALSACVAAASRHTSTSKPTPAQYVLRRPHIRQVVRRSLPAKICMHAMSPSKCACAVSSAPYTTKIVVRAT
ncbi:hypothetical protein BV25DRAFT_649241 [Artomyces pyxidatus]|uniref:Uncharacterized protein n=1 Tax=Artomyces pyxidatus TaxID=48021 RepID=A0ACB8SDJ1_9AGAM|nr:hypothetical protein BV25DRAFT_649241 [Artomyces pyxidatus]